MILPFAVDTGSLRPDFLRIGSNIKFIVFSKSGLELLTKIAESALNVKNPFF